MFNKGNMGQLMKQAQQMQEQMEKMQKKLAKSEVTGESGAGLVKVILTGAYCCRKVDIDNSLLSEDKEMLEDLIIAAFNDALRRVAEIKESKMVDVTGQLPLPDGFKLPF